MPRTTGYINKYRQSRGFGFIESPSYPGTEIFFHCKQIINYLNSELYQTLNQSTVEIIDPPIEVFLNVEKTTRGFEANSIQLADLERTQESYIKIKQFLQTANFLESSTEDSFAKYVSLKVIAKFGGDLSLKTFATDKVVNSAQKWEELVSIAEEWDSARSSLHKARIISNRDVIIRFSDHLLRQLGFEPLAGPDGYELDASIPMFTQKVKPIKTPFATLERVSSWSFIFLSDTAALADVLHMRPRLIKYDFSELKILILLDDNETIKTDKYSVAKLPQTEILRLLLKTNKDIDTTQQVGGVLRAVLPKTSLQPYDAGVAYSEKMFSGRVQERERILASPTANFAVYGGRRIGKTWFLQDLVWKCKEPPYDGLYLPLYVSMQPAYTSQDAVRLIQEAIGFRFGIEKHEGTYTFSLLRNRFLKLYQDHNKTILLALDEIDRLVRAGQNGMEFFEELRSFQNTYPEAIKFVFAGFKDLMKSFTRLRDNDALGNWVRENHFSLGCLSQEDLQDLVARLRWVGANFNLEDMLNKVYDLTSGHPYYSHTLCEAISNAVVDQNIKSLHPSDVDKYVTDQFFKKVFETFRKNLNSLQKLIGKIFVDSQDGILEEDIYRELKLREIDISESQLNDEMNILVACSVFSTQGKKYMPVMYSINKSFFGTLSEEDLIIRVLLKEDEDENESGEG